jgi:hypothetical protein
MRLDGHAFSRPLTPAHQDPVAVRETLFPLPLSTFEQHFLLDDSPSYPAQFFCRLQLSGRLRQHFLNEALHAALSRHPLLTAVVRQADKKSPQWVPEPKPFPQVEWIEQEPTQGFPPAGHLDIRARPGLHVIAISGSDKSDIILQCHHAACDGLGALDFATDLLTAYANAVSGSDSYRFKPLDASRLISRDSLPLSGWQLFRWGMRRMLSLRSAWRFYRRKPVPVMPHRPDFDAKFPPPAFPEACVHHFSREESVTLAAMAQGSETSLTGFLVRDLLLALDQWRRQTGLPADESLRLMVPINMRSPGDRRTPAANIVSTVFLDYCPSREPDSDALLLRINRLLEEIKHDNLGMGWLLALRLLQRLPRGWAKARHSRRRCLVSTLLTNLGPALAASPLPRSDRHLIVGDMILEEVEFLSVTRPLQCLGIAVSNYAGRLSLGMRYDSRVLPAERAQELLDVYVRALRTSIQSEQRRPG